MNTRYFAPAFVLAACVCPAAEEPLVLATYPVADLVLEVTDYPYNADSPLKRNASPAAGGGFRGGGGGLGGGGGGFGGGGGGAFSIRDISHRGRVPVHTVQRIGGGRARVGEQAGDPQAITMGGLIDTIISCVATESWAENGGGEAEIRPLGGMLVISQTKAVHTQIESLLGMIRRDVGARPSVNVDARWLMLTSDEVASLVADQGTPGVPLVKADRLADLTRRSTTLRAAATCFSGQLIHLVSGTEKSFVVSWIPVVGSIDHPQDNLRFVSHSRSPFRLASDTAVGSRQAGVGYQPIIQPINMGFVLEIRSTVNPDGKTAVVDLSTNLTFNSKQPQEAKPPKGDSMTPEVDRPVTEQMRFASTFRMPLGKPVLVGGLSYSPAESVNAPAEAAARNESRQAYLVLQLR